MATAHRPYYPPPPIGAQSRPVASDLPVYFAVLLGYILLLPPQLNTTILGSVLPPYRFFLIPATLYVVACIINGRLRLTWPDFFVAGAAAWTCFSLFMTSKQIDAFTASFAQASDTALAYFFARAAFRSLRDVRMFLLLLLPGLAIVGGVLVVESITHNHILQPFFANLTGRSFSALGGERLGLLRAHGPFPHPILAGIFFASFLPLYWLSGLRGWPFFVGILASISSFFTVSSAALLALAVGTGLVTYNWLSERIANLSWRMFFVVSILVTFVLEFGTKAGSFSMLMRFASLNSYSAYNRVLIWKYGTENVEKNPWFGIGYADWERPSWMKGSVDHYWLLQAIQFGVIPPLLIAAACAVGIYVLARRSAHSSPIDARFERGIAIAMAVFAFGVVSVAIWLSAQVWFFTLLGITVSLGYAQRSRVIPRSPALVDTLQLQTRQALPHSKPNTPQQSEQAGTR